MKASFKLTIVVLCLVGVFTLSCSSHGREPWAAVPQPLRERLNERLKVLVAHMRAEQYDKVYDLFSDAYTEELKTFHRSSKTEYLTAINDMPKESPAFDDFIPASSTKKAEGVWAISGVIISRYNNQKFERKSSVEARWEKGDWYFSEFTYERE